MIRWATLPLLLALLLGLSACTDETQAPTPEPPPGAVQGKKETRVEAPAPDLDPGPESDRVVMTLSTGGPVIIDLYEKAAPKHAANFKYLVRKGYYEGLTFHRVLEDFVAQTGDPTATGRGGAAWTVPAEIGKPHVKGALGAARKADTTNPKRKSNGSQFYVCLDRLPQLDGAYTVFGRVEKGIGYVEQVKTGDRAKRGILHPIGSGDTIESVRIQPGKAPEPTDEKTDDETEAESGEAEAESGETGSEKEDVLFPADDDRVVLELSTGGPVVIDLFEEDAPKHAKNFKKLVRDGFYDGLTFHRVIDGFMAQGGDPTATGQGGPGYTIPAEIKRKHLRGSVAAARTSDAVNPKKESSGSQFYICFEPQPQLDKLGYTVFGQVIEGMEHVDALKRGNPRKNGVVTPTGSGDKIKKATVVKAGETWPKEKSDE